MINKNKIILLTCGFVFGALITLSFSVLVGTNTQEKIFGVDENQYGDTFKHSKSSNQDNNKFCNDNTSKIVSGSQSVNVINSKSRSTQNQSNLGTMMESDNFLIETSSKKILSLVNYMSSSPSHLDEAISIILTDPNSERRSRLIDAARNLPDNEAAIIGQALIDSNRTQDKLAGLSFLGSLDSENLPEVIEHALEHERNPNVIQAALQWTVNVSESNLFNDVRSSVETFAFDSPNRLIKREALTAMLYWDQDDFLALNEIDSLLSSTNDEERDVALYSMSNSQAAATGKSEYWNTIHNTLNNIVKNDDLAVHARLQALQILKDISGRPP